MAHGSHVSDGGAGAAATGLWQGLRCCWTMLPRHVRTAKRNAFSCMAVVWSHFSSSVWTHVNDSAIGVVRVGNPKSGRRMKLKNTRRRHRAFIPFRFRTVRGAGFVNRSASGERTGRTAGSDTARGLSIDDCVRYVSDPVRGRAPTTQPTRARLTYIISVLGEIDGDKCSPDFL